LPKTDGYDFTRLNKQLYGTCDLFVEKASDGLMPALMGFDDVFRSIIYERPSTSYLALPLGHPSPEEHRENDVEKECHNKGDASGYECALNKAIETFAGDRVNDGIDDSSDDCAKQTLPQRSDYIVPIHNSLSLMIFPRVLLHTIKVFTPLAQNIHDKCVNIFGAEENHLVAFFMYVKVIPVNFETLCFFTSIVPPNWSRESAIWGLSFYQLKQR
jgi:hypothetical protein